LNLKFNYPNLSQANAVPNRIHSVGIGATTRVARDVRRLIGGKLERAQRDLAGDVKKLKGFRHKYRLRAGNYRVLFELEGDCLVVYDVGDRKDIYE
jgi:mRNA interferase RelE/StbE